MPRDSKSLEDLVPAARGRAYAFIADAEMQIPGLKIIVTCTTRSLETQKSLYVIGRRGIEGERCVTNCSGEEGNESMHFFEIAFDIFPMLYGKPIFGMPDGDEVSDPIWQKLGELGEKQGLEWAGRWKHNREGPHFQYTGGLNLVQLRDGQRPT